MSLVDGIFNYTVNKSLSSRQQFPWAASVPKYMFNEFVLPFASESASLRVCVSVSVCPAPLCALLRLPCCRVH